MTRFRTLAAVVVAFCALVAGAGAIGNGVPDGNAHPNVGMLAIGVEEDGQLVRYVSWCSGSYGGPRTGQPAEKVFVTAGHCVNSLPDEGTPAAQLWVTFDPEATFDEETGAVTSASSWHQASGIGFDPALGDYGVVLLESVPTGLAPVQLPAAGLLDEADRPGRAQAGDRLRQRRLRRRPDLHARTAAVGAPARPHVLGSSTAPTPQSRSQRAAITTAGQTTTTAASTRARRERSTGSI